MAKTFPFAAIVGQDEMGMALQIVAVDPTVGGVWFSVTEEQANLPLLERWQIYSLPSMWCKLALMAALPKTALALAMSALS